LNKLTILGGSSPYTIGLINAIQVSQKPLPPMELLLFGRNTENLLLIQQYAKYRLAPLGWTVLSTTNRLEALDSASIIIHQIRYGGLKERSELENLMNSYNVPSDETLGIAPLLSAPSVVPEVKSLAKDLKNTCPNAWIINLTNPLSIVTAILARENLHCVGLCELPSVTFQQICHLLGVSVDEVTWDYCGLNHRGFIYNIYSKSCNLLPYLVNTWEKQKSLGNLSAEDIQELNAVPLKYFPLFIGKNKNRVGRAMYLSNLRKQILNELQQAPTTYPPSLEKRSPVWYPFSVVPFLSAITSRDGRTEVVNVLQNGIVREMKARIFGDEIQPLSISNPGNTVQQWLKVFTNHEHTILSAVLDPSIEGIETALSVDPLIPETSIKSLAKAIYKRF